MDLKAKYSAWKSELRHTTRLSCLVIVLLFQVVSYCSPTTIIDSLKKVLPSKTGIEKVKILSDLSYEYYQNQPDSGVIFGELALTLAEKLNNKTEIANAKTSLSSCYWVLGNNEKALNLLLSALHTFEELKDSSSVCVALQNIAVLYDYQKDYDKAMQYYMKELQISEKRKTVTALSYHNIGDLYNTLEQYDKAMEFFKKAIKAGGDPDCECFAVYSIGTIYEGKKNYKKATEYFDRALVMADRITNNVRTRAYVYLHYGDFQRTIKNPKKGLYYLNEGLELAKQIKEKKLLQDYYLVLADYHAEINNYDSAYKYLELHSQIQDSLFEEQSHKNLMEMEAKYEAGKRESEIALLIKDKEINSAILKKANATRNYLVIISVLIIISTFVIYYIKARSITRLKEKQNIINNQNARLESANKAMEDSREELEELNRNLEVRVNEEVTKRELQQVMLMQKSKLESLGIFSAGIAHEINQPLTSISFTIENMMYKKEKEKLPESYFENKFKLINEDIARITKIINHIRTFAREQGKIAFDSFTLNEVVLNSQLIVSSGLHNRNINVILNLHDEPACILGNKYRLEQVLLNLIINARHAVENRESLNEDLNFQKTILIKTFNENNRAVLLIEDNGTGISEEIKSKIFEPFFTTKDPQNGTGLGLSIVYGIIKEHKGEIFVESVENEYTRVFIKIPSIKQEKYEAA